MSEKLTQKRLKEVLHYDLETGVFIRLQSIYISKINSIAGCIDCMGYRTIKIDNIQYRAARLAHLYVEGYFPENIMDHINRIRSDDRWSNLRHVSHQCNMINRPTFKTNISGVTGVSRNKAHKKWEVHIIRKYLGSYKNFYEAVCMRLAAEQCLDWGGCDSSSPAFKYVQDMLVQK